MDSSQLWYIKLERDQALPPPLRLNKAIWQENRSPNQAKDSGTSLIKGILKGQFCTSYNSHMKAQFCVIWKQ